MFELETKRLRLIPLTPYQLELLMEDTGKLEKELFVKYDGVEIEGHMLEATREQFLVCLTDTENYVWHTFWQFVLKEENKIIGSACFKGMPDSEGCVEIGYGINQTYENMGLTKEAAKEMCTWALLSGKAKYITAETEKDNIPTRKILEYCGLKIYKETEEAYFWRSK